VQQFERGTEFEDLNLNLKLNNNGSFKEKVSSSDDGSNMAGRVLSD
jgi:hypothetical protein